MKKTLSAIVAVLMITAMLAMSVFAYTDAYPFSKDYGFDPASGELLIGELFGTEPWGESENTFEKAWDGDTTTFFDPLEPGVQCHSGVKLSEEYILTEIRIHPRDGFLDRFEGATIQGSNDGENWTSIFVAGAPAEALDYQVIKAADFIAGTNVGYSMYRYANQGKADGTGVHGDVAEVELYGEVKNVPVVEEVAPVEVAAPAEEAPVAVAVAPVVVAPQTNDNFVLSVSLMSVALIAAFVVMKKRVAR